MRRALINGVFQSGVCRWLSGSAREEGTKMLENTGVCRLLGPLGPSERVYLCRKPRSGI